MKPIEKIKISKDSLFLLAYTIVFLMPSYFSNSLLNFLDNIFLILGFCFLFLKKYKPSKIILIICLFYFYLIFISFIKSTDSADIHLIVSNLKMVLYLAAIDYSLKNHEKNIVNILFYFIAIVVVLDFFILLLYPNGWYFTENVYNEWTTTLAPQWLLGNKNNHTTWYILAIYLSCIKCIGNTKKMNRIIAVVLTLMAFTAMLILESATSIVVMGIIAIGAGCFILRKKQFKWVPNSYFLLGCYIVFVLLILFGITSFLSPIVVGILGKDLSFTSRTVVWERVIELIKESPVFGSGQISGDYASELLGSVSFVNVHNQYLQILWQTGIIGLFIYAYFIFCITKNIKKETNNNFKFLKLTIFFALLLKFIFEVEMNLNSWLIFLLLAQRFESMERISLKQKGGTSRECRKLMFNLERQY